jgi:SAM-dependent MidA family methyltransferase
MTPLARRIARLIAATGPIGVDQLMSLCLLDPEHGYYTRREPFGTAGDFITAPEVSQMFGELLAVWTVAAWRALAAPRRFSLVEIGPGRGTLMADMLRTIARLDPAMKAAAGIVLVEASPRQQAEQRRRLAADASRIRWQAHLEEGPLPGPLIILGNEIFDALPVRQFVRTPAGWRERVVGLDQTGALCFMAGPAGIDPALLPAGADEAPEGSVFEISPAREGLMSEIAGLLARQGGAGLFIDYGHAAPGFGDTLQAVRHHRFDPPLAHPGEADLTAHVDFSALAAAARAGGLVPFIREQGEFLLSMGLLERAGRLGAEMNEAGRERIRAEVERLAGAEEMGRLFKVMAVLPPGLVLHPFDD